jgi:hypothetical protein
MGYDMCDCPSHAGDVDHRSCSAGCHPEKQDSLIWYLEMKCNEDMMSERASFRMLLQCKYAKRPRYA